MSEAKHAMSPTSAAIPNASISRSAGSTAAARRGGQRRAPDGRSRLSDIEVVDQRTARVDGATLGLRNLEALEQLAAGDAEQVRHRIRLAEHRLAVIQEPAHQRANTIVVRSARRTP
jgi:hypothetical protein